MLTHFDVTNYRGFGSSYRMERLAPVNLLVGKNNSGKTALIEAVHFLSSGGNPWVLADAANRRGEMIFASREGRDTFYPDLSHFFFGHELSKGSCFSVRSGNGYPSLSVRLTAPDDTATPAELFEAEREERAAFEVVIDGAAKSWSRMRGLTVSEKGGFLLDPRFRYRGVSIQDADESRPAIFIPPDSLNQRRLAELWRDVVLESRQEFVASALRLIEPDLAQIHFLPMDYAFRPANSALGIVALCPPAVRPVPLGSMGDGMRRLLNLAISLSRASRGVLMVDEIDTGLHYSVLADMWKLIVGTAVANDIQVFATTHSWDCVVGLKDHCRANPDDMQHVAVHKVDRALKHSVPFGGEEFVRAVEGGVELR